MLLKVAERIRQSIAGQAFSLYSASEKSYDKHRGFQQPSSQSISLVF